MSFKEIPAAAVSLPAGALAGITVLDLTRVVAGPYCSMLFADAGAMVIKIEHPSDADYVRNFPPIREIDGEQRSGFFAQYNRNKLGVSLNLKDFDGKQAFLDMVSKADVVIENFRPGTMEKLDLGFAVLTKHNPKIVLTAISGFGQFGPNSSRPAYDNSAQASGGLWSMNGPPDTPTRVGTIIGDLAASLYAAFGTMVALRAAATSGNGQVVDVSQQDSVLSLTETAVVNYTQTGEIAVPLGDDHPFVRPYGRYRCQDGYVFFGAYTDKFWREACIVFGEPELGQDPQIDTMEKRFREDVYEERVRPIVERWCAGRTKAQLEQLASDRFPMSPINNIAEVVRDPHLAARKMVVPVEYGGVQFEVFGSPVKLSATPGVTGGVVPLLGQHNEEIYLGWLGMAREHYEYLRAKGAI